MQNKAALLWFIMCLILLAALGYLGTQYYLLTTQLALIQTQVASTTSAYSTITSKLRGRLDSATEQLLEEQFRNNTFESQLNMIQGNVDQIQKVQSTDKELLQKYSKVFFLNENYIPARLAPINISYIHTTDNVLIFQSDALPFLVRLMDAAGVADIHLKIVSGYRSFGDQTALKSTYKMTYGVGANKFSAEQGYSEHQLGTTIDFTTSELGDLSSKFDGSSGYTWLTEHAHEYGFVLSYPKGNTYYEYEPWHWRFVGTALAKRLHDEDKHFYDLDQRDIDQYRGAMFD